MTIPAPVLLSDEAPPVASAEDVRAVYPASYAEKTEDEAPVLAAIVDGETAMFVAYQDASAHAAVQSDPARATEINLDGHAEDRGVKRAAGETDEPLRARMFFPSGVVARNAIRAAANKVLEQYTDTEVVLWESVVDQWFSFSAASTLTTLAMFVGSTPENSGPAYPDRYYDARTWARPPGPMAVGHPGGRYFILHVPDLGGVDDAVDHVFSAASTGEDTALFVFSAASMPAGETTHAFASTKAALGIYEAIVAAVTPLVGHGIRWKMIANL